MKKIIFALFGLVLLFGCKVAEKADTTRPESNVCQAPEGDGLIFWTKDIPHVLKVGDPWSFYNSSEIKLEARVARLGETFVDGGLVQIDSLRDLIRTVPVLTPGDIVEIKKDAQGNIISIKDRFSLESTTFTFEFKIVDGYASLDKTKPGLIMFRGKAYNVPIKTDDVCRLKVRYIRDEVLEKDTKAAEGVKPGNVVIPPKR